MNLMILYCPKDNTILEHTLSEWNSYDTKTNGVGSGIYFYQLTFSVQRSSNRDSKTKKDFIAIIINVENTNQ